MGQICLYCGMILWDWIITTGLHSQQEGEGKLKQFQIVKRKIYNHDVITKQGNNSTVPNSNYIRPLREQANSILNGYGLEAKSQTNQTL